MDSSWLVAAAVAAALVYMVACNRAPTTTVDGAPAAKVQRVGGPQAKQLVKDGALIVDVRTPGEFAGGHIDGAVNIPVDAVGARLAEFGAKDKPVVVYCRSGARSSSAAGVLTRNGYQQVYDLGGIGNW